jgi:cobaltochelatase CobS
MVKGGNEMERLTDKQLKELVVLYNTHHNTRFKSTSSGIRWRAQDAYELFKGNFWLLLKYASATDKKPISYALARSNVLDYITNNGIVLPNETTESTPTAVEQPKEEVKEMDNGVMTLGLIEKALAKVMLEEYAPKVAEKAIENLKEFVKSEYGTLSRQVELKVLDKVVLKETTHEKFDQVLQLVQLGKAVYLYGPSGTGKNIIAHQIAKALQLDFYFNNAVQNGFSLEGYTDANGKYIETEFYRAFTKGGVYMLDEMDASVAEVLILLNAALANGYFTFPGIGQVKAHKDFRVIAAGNTKGSGASREYNSRNELDQATLNRFLFVEINYSTQIENSLTTNAELLDFAREFRKAIKHCGIKKVVSYREIINMRDLIQVGWDFKDVLDVALIKGLDRDDVSMIKGSMNISNQYTKGLQQWLETK